MKRIYYNSVYLIGKDTKIKGIYNKIILVPFGEYIPFKRFLPKAQHLTPITESYDPGSLYTIFTLEKDKKIIPFASVICIEDIYPGLIKKFVKQGALFIVNVTNDGWYDKTPCAYQHFAHSIFRAVENRVPLVRCANTGVSAIISPKGDVVQIVSQGKRITDIPGILCADISLDPEHQLTFYTKYGDVFVFFSGGLVLLYLLQNKIYRIMRRIKRRYFRERPVP